jgi:hypothetical protein
MTFVAMLIGFLSFLTAFMSLLCNESYTAFRAQSLAEGEQIVQSIKSYYVDQLKEGKLVHVTERATTAELLTDDTFQLEIKEAIKLKRIVEMYQWQESYDYFQFHYLYEQVWAKQQIDSSEFDAPERYHNPEMPLSEKTFLAQQVMLERFRLSATVIEQMEHYQSQAVPRKTLRQVQKNFYRQFPDKKLLLYDTGYYIGRNPLNPKIGDLRIRYEIVPSETVTVVAKQQSSNLVPYQTEIGGEIELFEYGTVSANDMFLKNKVSNLMNSLPLRVIGFLTLFLGFYMMVVALKQLLNFPTLLDTVSEQVRWALFANIIILLIFMIGRKFGFQWLSLISILLFEESFLYLISLLLYMLFSAIANNLSDSKDFLEKRLGRINWVSLMIITVSFYLILIALIWMDYLPNLTMILIVIALTFLFFLRSTHNLFEKPPLELPKQMLKAETQVPKKEFGIS